MNNHKIINNKLIKNKWKRKAECSTKPSKSEELLTQSEAEKDPSLGNYQQESQALQVKVAEFKDSLD